MERISNRILRRILLPRGPEGPPLVLLARFTSFSSNHHPHHYPLFSNLTRAPAKDSKEIEKDLRSSHR